MATDLEKTLRKAGYQALPVPRSKSGPTTVVAYRRGQLYVVRNAGTCLPLRVTPDPAVDTIQFNREFKLATNAVVDLLAQIFGIGKAKGELDVRNVKSATVQMGGLTHETIQTGELVDQLMVMVDSPCKRDVLVRDHFTIVAALKADSFRFTFRSEKGTTVKLSGADASNLFKVDSTTTVGVTDSGEVVVNAPAYVGVVVWDGGTMAKELKRAQRASIRVGPQTPQGSGRKQVAMSSLAPGKVSLLGRTGSKVSMHAHGNDPITPVRHRLLKGTELVAKAVGPDQLAMWRMRSLRGSGTRVSAVRIVASKPTGLKLRQMKGRTFPR